MGGRFGRPRIRREKRKKFYRGVYLQLCSNLFYQKFLGNLNIWRASRAYRRSGGQKERGKGEGIFARPRFFEAVVF